MSRRTKAWFQETVSGREHECSICHARGPWGPEWCWYGSIYDLDGPGPGERTKRKQRPIQKFCSDDCKRVAIAKKKVPANAPVLDE